MLRPALPSRRVRKHQTCLNPRCNSEQVDVYADGTSFCNTCKQALSNYDSIASLNVFKKSSIDTEKGSTDMPEETVTVMKSKKVMLNFGQRTQIDVALREALILFPEEKMCQYKGGFSDGVVADALGSPFNDRHVTLHRLREFGELKTGSRSQHTLALQLEELTARVVALESHVERLLGVMETLLK